MSAAVRRGRWFPLLVVLLAALAGVYLSTLFPKGAPPSIPG